MAIFLAAYQPQGPTLLAFAAGLQTRVYPGHVSVCVHVAHESTVLPLSACLSCLLRITTRLLFIVSFFIRRGRCIYRSSRAAGVQTRVHYCIRGLSLCVHVAQQEGTVLPLSACLLSVANTSLFEEVHTAAPMRQDLPAFLANAELRVQHLTGIRVQCNCQMLHDVD